jgi:predicted O-linked N-acetylglucosamine transferase (SPINDLY family)
MFVGNRIVKEKFIFPQNITPLADRESYGHSKIRIGYLSGDLCSHAVGFLMPEIFELHDRERFEIYAYDYSKEDGTHTRLRIKHSTEHFTSIQNLTDQQAANKIRQDEIDILVDLHGLSQGLRPGILAQRPARVQMTYLGYIGTTMMPYLDYVITDKYCFNDDLAKYYSERPLLLDRCCIPTDRKRLVSEVPTKASQGLPEDKFIFATFNNAYKMNRPMFSSWMRILQQVPNSILWIVEDNPWAGENLKQEAARSGVDISRLIFAQRVIPPEYLARMKLVDLFLDNHPYNAGSTASDIAWMGAPMITLSGKTFVSRMAGSILHHSGLSGLITHSYEQYEALAITLSSRPDLLQAIKLQLAQQHAEGGAFDMKLFTRDLEEKYLSSLV